MINKPTEEELIANEVRYEDIGGIRHYCVADVRGKFPDMKFDIKQIKASEIGNLIPYGAIEPMTEFDKNAVELWKSKR